MIKLSELLSIAIFMVASASAQVPNWIQSSTASTPQARSEHAMSYDSGRGTAVVFGVVDGANDRFFGIVTVPHQYVDDARPGLQQKGPRVPGGVGGGSGD